MLSFLKFQKWVLLIILFSSCFATEKNEGIAYMRKYKMDSTEIQIPYITKERGSLHNFTFEKYTDSSLYMIRFSKIKDTVSADSLKLYSKEEYFPQQDMKGVMIYHDSALILKFTVPSYNGNKITHWKPFQFNGKYRLIHIKPE
jgi:hypothetical protein